MALVAALLFGPSAAEGRVGGLDPTFGEGGRVTTQVAVDDRVWMAIAPDGSAVLADDRLLIRYSADGKSEPSFGVDGELTLPERLDGMAFLPQSVAFDSQGRLVVFGAVRDPNQQFKAPPYASVVEVTEAAVLRLMPNGELDSSFGEGKGFIRSDFGLPTEPELNSELPTVRIATGRVDGQDRPIFIAAVAGSTGRCYYAHASQTWLPRAVVRLTTAGGIDPTFGGGTGIAAIGGGEATPALALDATNAPVVAVGIENCRLGGNRIFRFGVDGARSGDFASGGVGTYPGLSFSAIEPSGAIVFGKGRPATNVIRIRPDGNRDTTFGEDGKAVVRMPRGARRTLRPVAVDEQGRILLVGSFSLPAPNTQRQRKERRSKGSFVAITRLLPTGETDVSLGEGGWIVTRFSRPKQIYVEHASLDPQGRLLIAVGSKRSGQPPGSGLVLARYLLDG